MKGTFANMRKCSELDSHRDGKLVYFSHRWKVERLLPLSRNVKPHQDAMTTASAEISPTADADGTSTAHRQTSILRHQP